MPSTKLTPMLPEGQALSFRAVASPLRLRERARVRVQKKAACHDLNICRNSETVSSNSPLPRGSGSEVTWRRRLAGILVLNWLCGIGRAQSLNIVPPDLEIAANLARKPLHCPLRPRMLCRERCGSIAAVGYFRAGPGRGAEPYTMTGNQQGPADFNFTRSFLCFDSLNFSVSLWASLSS